jgi:uncharacterized hydrophobic protein (TIGR00271 family)
MRQRLMTPAGGVDATVPPAAPVSPPPLADARLDLGQATLDDLFPEGPALRRSLVTYAVLLALAAVIATLGLISDSVAAIIGAMVVAPLGGAIMAFAGALVTDRRWWQGVTLLQVFLGAVMVVAIAFGISALLPQMLSFNASIEARTHPGLADLGIALAAGAAGAWVSARRTGSDALPGVAIAVSLVPPLATVGIALEHGRSEDVAGAALLFFTNFTAIVVVACIVFILLGAMRTGALGSRRRLELGVLLTTLALVILAVPLTARTVGNLMEVADAGQVAPDVRTWVGRRDLAVLDYSINESTVHLVLAGPDAPASVDELAQSVSSRLGRPMAVEVEYAPTILLRSGEDPDTP